ncbi:MAG: hypothetical protein JO276_00720 [Sphingomonadaceae bacterium]|nr:hypothetical protein [Sphingomonadaceae bacterium]
MMRHFPRFALFATLLTVCSATSVQSHARRATVIRPENIGEAIARVHLIANPDQRFAALEQIETALERDSSHIDDSDVHALAALMSDDSDMVRFAAATAIGLIGPRAAAAAPALQAALPRIECEWGGHNSRAAIIYAFRRIGVTPVERDCPPVDFRAPRH